MSWQADIKNLHEKASSLGVDLTEFEDELRNDEGWYTESNIQEFIECQNLQIAKQHEEIAEYRDALESTNRELLCVINKYNQKLKDGICSSDLDDPEYVDAQTVHDNQVLLAKHNKGEL